MQKHKAPSLIVNRKRKEALARIAELEKSLFIKSGGSEHRRAKERLLFLLVSEQEAIAKALIRKAKAGDVKAISEVLNRLYGKATETIDLGGTVQFSLKKLAEEREMLQARVIDTAIAQVVRDNEEEEN